MKAPSLKWPSSSTTSAWTVVASFPNFGRQPSTVVWSPHQNDLLEDLGFHAVYFHYVPRDEREVMLSCLIKGISTSLSAGEGDVDLRDVSSFFGPGTLSVASNE